MPQPAGAPAGDAPAAGWRGRLSLTCRARDGRSTVHDRHDGPLRLLRSLHPEGPSVCHQVLVHPPGGLVGGDALAIDIDVGPQAHSLLTTPGATRFYRSDGRIARQSVDARVDAGGRLEWLPLETIAYRGTRAVNRMRFTLAPGATMIGWDLLALGLPASGQPFDDGRFEQEIALPGLWLDRGIVDPGDEAGRRLLASPLGWDRCTALATMWCAVGDDWPGPVQDALLAGARDAMDAAALDGRCGATAPHARVVVVRALAERVEPLWHALQAVRERWRRTLWSLDAAPPRVWRT